VRDDLNEPLNGRVDVFPQNLISLLLMARWWTQFPQNDTGAMGREGRTGSMGSYDRTISQTGVMEGKDDWMNI
jgi:hypothetical protein